MSGVAHDLLKTHEQVATASSHLLVGHARKRLLEVPEGTDSDHEIDQPPPADLICQSASPPPAPTYGPVVCICPPRLDGGTTLQLRVGPQTEWHVELNIALGRIMAAKRRGEPGPFAIMLPDPRAGGSIPFEAMVTGSDRPVVELVAHGQTQITIHVRSGLVLLAARREEVWAHGFEAWLTRWLDLASWWFLVRRCRKPRQAARCGWQVRNVELCADFTGLVVTRNDPGRFTGRGRNRSIETEGYHDDFVETVGIGRRGRNALSLETHDKSLCIRRRDGIDPVNSIYAPIWSAYGWDGIQPVRRVEVRAHGRALAVVDAKTGEVIDLRDPAALLDNDLLCRFWLYATTKIRLTTPAESTSARTRRHPTDPRWVAVQQAAGLPNLGASSFRRLPAIGGQSIEIRRRTAITQLLRSMASLLVLDSVESSRENLGEAAIARVAALLRGNRLSDEVALAQARLQGCVPPRVPTQSGVDIAREHARRAVAAMDIFGAGVDACVGAEEAV